MEEIKTAIDNRQKTKSCMHACVYTDVAIKRVMEEFVAYVEDLADWIGEKSVIDTGTESSSIIALAQIDGARAMTQRILDYLHENE